MLAFLLSWSLHATEIRPLHEVISKRASGILHFEGEDESFRESTLYFQDGKYRISIAEMPTVVLNPDKVATSVRKYGKGGWDIVFYSWSNSSVGWAVDIMIHGDEILAQEHAHEKLPAEIVLPRARLKIMRSMFFKVADGHYFDESQDHAATRLLTVRDIAQKDGRLFTFRDHSRRCAEGLTEQNRIRVRE